MNTLDRDLNPQGELGQSEVIHEESTALSVGDQTRLQRMGEEGLSHLTTFIISVRSQDHAFESSRDMSTRPQKRPSRELCLNGSIRMTREFPNSPAELPPEPPGL